MRITHVVTGLELGGAETVLERLVSADGRNEHAVISLYREGPLGKRLQERGIPVYSIGLARGKVPRARQVLELRKVIRATRPALVQTWMYHANVLAGVLARLDRIPAFWNIRRTSLDPATISASTRIMAALGARLSGVIPQQIICCAEAAASEHVRHGYRGDKFLIIPNGIDTSLFSPDPTARRVIREQLGIDGDVHLIGCVGRFHPDKGHGTLLAALQLLRNAHPALRCVLAGPEPQDSGLAALADRWGVRDRLLVLGPRNDVPAIMNALDLHVSSSDTEGFPNVIAEAMACGTPCIATDVGDTRSVIGSSGWVVPPRSPEELANAIEKGLAHLDLPSRADLQRNCRDRCIEKFSLGRMVAAYQAAWSSAHGQ